MPITVFEGMYVQPKKEKLAKNQELRKIWYPVVGVRTQIRKKDDKEYEEIAAIMIIEEWKFFYLYPSEVFVSVGIPRQNEPKKDKSQPE